MTEGRSAKGVSAMLWLALVWPPLAAAQDGSGEAGSDAEPAWATCEHYERLLAGDATAAAPAADLRQLPYHSGARIDPDAEAVAPVSGLVFEPPRQTAAVGAAEVTMAAGERLLAMVTLRGGALLVALVATGVDDDDVAGAEGLVLTELERTESGYLPVGWDGEPASPPVVALPGFLLRQWGQAEPEQPRWELSQVGDQLVLLHHSVHYCPGGCVEYCGWLRRTLAYRVDSGGGLALAGVVPRESAMNGSNVLSGGVFHFATEFADLDGDGLLDLRIQPQWSTRHADCGDELERAARPDRTQIDRSLTISPIRTHSRLIDDRWSPVETDLSDLMLPSYLRAVRTGQAGRPEATRAALSDFVLGLEMLLGPPRPGRDAYSLQHWIFEAPEAGDSAGEMRDAPWPASRARLLEMMVGAASLLTLLESQDEAEPSEDLRTRLRSSGRFGVCDDDGETEIDDTVWLRWH